MWIKYFRQRRLQSILILLIVSICTTLMAGAMSILTSLDKPCRDFAKQCDAASLKVYYHAPDDAGAYKLGEQFSKLPNVKRVEYERRHYIQENLILQGKKAELFANLTEYNAKIYASSVYLEGNNNAGNLLADNECILPASIGNEYDLHVGDTITVQFEAADITYKVAAVFTDPYQTSTAFDSNILVKKLPGNIDSSIVIYVYGTEGIAGDQIVENFREKNGGLLNASTYTLEERMDNGLMVGRIIGALFLSIGIIMLLVSALMIHYMIKNAMLSDSKTIAVYKTLGYTSNEILFNYLKFYFSIVTFACVLGMMSSAFISNQILSSIFENMGQLKVEHSLLSGILCYVVIVVFVITIITFSILKMKRVKAVTALSGMDYGGVKKKKSYKGNSTLQFSALGIAYRSFSREKRNAVNIIITCIITIFSINFIVISLDVANSMKEHNDYWLGIDKSSAVIEVLASKDYENIKSTVESDSRVDYCIPFSNQNTIAMKWKKGMSKTSMGAFVYDDFNLAKLPVSEGSNPKNKNEIAISTTIAKALHKSVGDYLEIYVNGTYKVDLLITGFFQTYYQAGDMCRLTTATYTENKVAFGYTNISVYLKDDKQIKSFINDIKDEIGSRISIVKRTEQFNSIMNLIVEPQQKAIPPVAALILLIAGINIFSIVYLRNLTTQKINGIYKCIGYTTGHLIISNLCYVLVIALVSVVITFPISLTTYSSIMKLSLSMFHFSSYPMQLNLGHLILANTAVILIFAASTLVSSNALFKVSARDLIQE